MRNRDNYIQFWSSFNLISKLNLQENFITQVYSSVTYVKFDFDSVISGIFNYLIGMYLLNNILLTLTEENKFSRNSMSIFLCKFACCSIFSFFKIIVIISKFIRLV